MKRVMKRVGAWSCGLAAFSVLAAPDLENGFANPPDQTKPWCYWYWISDNISRAGITRDLEGMARVGIGEALIGNIYLDDVQKGTVKALSEEWWGMVEHAIREGGRVGVNIGMFNCPGWSQSGGPWIRPEQAMRYLVSSQRRVKGPAEFAEKLAVPAEPFQRVAVLAFPVPAGEDDSALTRSPRITVAPALESAEKLMDGNLETALVLPPGAGQGRGQVVIDIVLDRPLAARSLALHPSTSAFSAQCELQAVDEAGQVRSLKTFRFDRSNMGVNVGPMPRGPVTVAFPAVTAQRFRLVMTQVSGRVALAEISLSAAARLEFHVEKQLGRMHPTPLPMWDAYLWPAPAEPEAPDLAVDPKRVVDLSDKLAADGTLRWDVPEGEWIMLLTGMTPTGTKNAPASPEGQGLEVDKMNRQAAQAHFDAFIGQLLERMAARDRRAFKHVVADSYEMGSQNWTDGFEGLFREQYGYDPKPWLPVLTGRLVGGADRSERFLWDLRRLVADRIAYDYVGGLRDACRRHGLELWLENYGHWGFPAEFLQYGGQADRVGGEFWATGDLGSIELRAASSAAHIYGQPIVSAEAFTSVLKFESTPWSLKRRGDWALTEGANHWVLHVNIHQPWEDRRPGVNAWFSTEFNRHNTWFEAGKAWIDYYRRCDFLLQQGWHVADVAYFIGEDTPKMTGTRRPELPPGYDFDYLNAEVIRQRLQVKDGRFVLPDGMSYRLLVLPELDTIRPELLRKIRELVAAGGAILGAPPLRSPSLQGFPGCDDEVRKLAAEIWAGCDGQTVKQTRFSKGRVFRGMELKPVLEALETPPDVAGFDPAKILWTHRAGPGLDIYFLSNQSEQPAEIAPVFRVPDRAPELWDAADASIARPAVFQPLPEGVRAPLSLDAGGSVFVVFRRPLASAARVSEVTRDGRVVLSAAAQPVVAVASVNHLAAANTFTMAGWVKPEAEVALPAEVNSGVFINLRRNDAVWPAHGGTSFPEGGHSCAGISVGRNGVVVYEHAANYFAPLLVHAAQLERWTHVAVVYEGGQPALYLGGELARRGLTSRLTVHSGVSAGPVGPGRFEGQLSEFTDFPQAMSADEVAALSRKDRPTSVSPLAPIDVTQAPEGVAARVSSPGSYRLRFANGKDRVIEVDDVPAAMEIAGPWEVRFPSGMAAPEQGRFDRLISWTAHTNEAIRYFSGVATYARAFDLPAGWVGKDRRVMLDLGRVEALAEVRVNGRDLGVLWKPPFVVDVTDAAKARANTLEVRVTGTWRNRLIGHAKYPEGFPGKTSLGRPQFQPYLTADLKLKGDEPLMPSGLLGPVYIRPLRVVGVNTP